MVRVCINCTYPLLNSKSEFCSWNCSQEYDTMEHIQHAEERKIMAVKVEKLVTVSDDLTGVEFAEGEGETVTFTLDGTKYEIDLNNKNATAFRKSFEKYVKAARIKPTVGRKAGQTNNSENAAIRAWAQTAGHQLGDRGRIPQHIVDAYHVAHPSA